VVARAKANARHTVVTLLSGLTVTTPLSHCCLTVATPLSHCCHTVVTLLSHCCHICCHTALLHCCCTVVTPPCTSTRQPRMLHREYRDTVAAQLHRHASGGRGAEGPEG
jgi:hypothetical protein